MPTMRPVDPRNHPFRPYRVAPPQPLPAMVEPDSEHFYSDGRVLARRVTVALTLGFWLGAAVILAVILRIV